MVKWCGRLESLATTTQMVNATPFMTLEANHPGNCSSWLLPNIFGLRGNIPNNLNFFDQMYDNLKKNRVIKFNFNRYTKKDFMYAEDFAKVLKVCIEDHIYGTFNCGYGNPVACNKLAEILINSLGYGNIEDLNEIKDEFFLNTSKIKSKIDLPAFKGLEKGIKEIISNNF